MNPWLEEYKKAKEIAKTSRIVLYSSGEQLIANTSKRLASVVAYCCFEDLIVSGFYIVDIGGIVIHNHKFIDNVKIRSGDKFEVNLTKFKIAKWHLDEMLPEDQC